MKKHAELSDVTKNHASLVLWEKKLEKETHAKQSNER